MLNDFQPWPDGWPQHFNGTNYPCDMLIGPCVCKAWHQPGEFAMACGVLHRNGKPVAESRTSMPLDTIEVPRAEWDRLNQRLTDLEAVIDRRCGGEVYGLIDDLNRRDAQIEKLNAALARESAKVHQQQRELMELRTELERAGDE